MYKTIISRDIYVWFLWQATNKQFILESFKIKEKGAFGAFVKLEIS